MEEPWITQEERISKGKKRVVLLLLDDGVDDADAVLPLTIRREAGEPLLQDQGIE